MIILIFIAQVAVGIYSLVAINDEKDLEDALRSGLVKTFSEYNTNQVKKDAMNGMQVTVSLYLLYNIDS